MQVYAWIKHKIHPDPSTGGSTRGDLIYIYPMVRDQGKLTHDSFFPVVIDLKIPCGDRFTIGTDGKEWDCTKCRYNDLDDCDVVKYSRALWSLGDIENPPKVIKKCRYNIDIDSILSVDSKKIVYKTINTREEEELIISRADNNPVTELTLHDKVVTR